LPRKSANSSCQRYPAGHDKLLADRGHLQIAFREEISTRMPTPEERATLDLGAGTPVLVYVRTAFTETRPVRVTVTTFAGDRNRIVYTLGDSSAMRREDDQ